MTFEEFKTVWREKEKQPRDPYLKITCLCGNCPFEYTPPSDEDLLTIYNVVYNDKFQEKA